MEKTANLKGLHETEIEILFNEVIDFYLKDIKEFHEKYTVDVHGYVEYLRYQITLVYLLADRMGVRLKKRRGKAV